MRVLVSLGALVLLAVGTSLVYGGDGNRLVLAWSAPAQDVSTAQLHGLVRDPKGALVSGAKVTVRDEQRNTERSTTTDAGGEYQILRLAPERPRKSLATTRPH